MGSACFPASAGRLYFLTAMPTARQAPGAPDGPSVQQLQRERHTEQTGLQLDSLLFLSIYPAEAVLPGPGRGIGEVSIFSHV